MVIKSKTFTSTKNLGALQGKHTPFKIYLVAPDQFVWQSKLQFLSIFKGLLSGWCLVEPYQPKTRWLVVPCPGGGKGGAVKGSLGKGMLMRPSNPYPV